MRACYLFAAQGQTEEKAQEAEEREEREGEVEELRKQMSDVGLEPSKEERNEAARQRTRQTSGCRQVGVCDPMSRSKTFSDSELYLGPLQQVLKLPKTEGFCYDSLKGRFY